MRSPCAVGAPAWTSRDRTIVWRRARPRTAVLTADPAIARMAAAAGGPDRRRHVRNPGSRCARSRARRRLRVARPRARVLRPRRARPVARPDQRGFGRPRARRLRAGSAGRVLVRAARPAEELFSCGLAVEPGAAGPRRRAAAQARPARARARAGRDGRSAGRPTRSPLRRSPSTSAGLRARLVAYAPELYAEVRPATVPPDDVVIEWPLAGHRPDRSACRARGSRSRSIAARSASSELARGGRPSARAMTEALDAGGVGTDVAVDRAGGRAWVLFREAA